MTFYWQNEKINPAAKTPQKGQCVQSQYINSVTFFYSFDRLSKMGTFAIISKGQYGKHM